MADQPKQRTIKHIFIASPGDVAEERNRFPKILETLNQLKAHEMGIDLVPLGWEDTLPGVGRPQALINTEVEKCDLFVMLLWRRWGTQPAEGSKYTSGTEEEFELARALNAKHGKPEIYLYFREVEQAMLADPGEHLRKVLDFRKKVERERSLLFKTYPGPDAWADLVMKNIAGWLDGHRPSQSPTEVQIPDEVKQQIEQLRTELGRLTEDHRTAQTKLLRMAADMGEKAVHAAQGGRFTEAEELFSKSLETYADARIVNAFGLFLRQIGSLGRAEEKFKEVAEIGTLQGDKSYLAIAYGNLGLIYRTRGDLGTAEQMLRKALALDEELGDKEGMARQFGNLGLIYRVRGDLDTAEQLHRKSLTLNEELGSKKGMAAQSGNLGVIFQTRGDLDTAEEMHRKSLALGEELGNKEGMASQYANLGLIHQTRGDVDTAEEMHRKALALSEELGHKEGMARDYGNLGVMYQTRGDLDTAEQMLRKALALNEELGRKAGMAIQYGNLGTIYTTRGDLVTAEQMQRKALALAEELGHKEGMATEYGNLGTIYTTRGDLVTAEQMHRKALAIDEELGRKEGMASHYGNLGLISQMRGDKQSAENHWRRALDLFQQVGAEPNAKLVRGWLHEIGVKV